jgi:segregation and condensation protein B
MNLDEQIMEMDPHKQYRSAIESILFVWGEPISLGRIAKILEIKTKEAKIILEDMMAAYQDEKRGFQIIEMDKHYQLCTLKENYRYIEALCETSKSKGLSNSALEVLAIVAYKQPLTKVDIEQIRGVNSDAAMQSLIDRDLVTVLGRLEKIGRPQIFGTTNQFLKTFGLKDLKELPPLEAFKDFSDYQINKENTNVTDSDDEN